MHRAFIITPKHRPTRGYDSIGRDTTSRPIEARTDCQCSKASLHLRLLVFMTSGDRQLMTAIDNFKRDVLSASISSVDNMKTMSSGHYCNVLDLLA